MSEEKEPPERIVIANYPNHVWGLDLTTVPLFGGLWTSWMPNAFPQCWPFCWWLALVVDHNSRRAMGFMIFRKQPTSRAIQKFLDRTIQKNGAKPKYIVTDCITDTRVLRDRKHRLAWLVRRYRSARDRGTA